MDVVAAIVEFNAGRDPLRLALKYAAMRTSPFVFLRGTCHLFYDRALPDVLPSGAPSVWVCGDLHLENFGCYKGDDRLVYFDLNDFDESALAPAAWELVRLLASVSTAAGTLGVSQTQAALLCEALVDAYADALATGHAQRIERDTAQGLVAKLLQGVRGRTRKDFLDRRTVAKGKQRKIVCDGKHALQASPEQAARAVDMVRAFAAAQADPGFFEVIDVAKRVAGTGSLGVERYVVLVAGKGSPDGNYLLDLKQALPSALARHLHLAQPAWPSHANRVVELQRRMQAVCAAFLHPLPRNQDSFVLRGLQPTEDRLSLAGPHVALDKLGQAIQDMGRLVAWAQLRSSGRQGSATADELIAFASDRKRWRNAWLSAAAVCSKQVLLDWEVYRKAYDDGGLGPPVRT